MYEDLRKIRTERGIRLKECADVIGVQEACYCKKELGDLKRPVPFPGFLDRL